MDLKESALLGGAEESHWYYKSKAAAMCRYLNGLSSTLVLDIGAGSGFFTRHLLRHTSVSQGLCVDTGYNGDSDEQYSGKLLQFRRSCDIVNAGLVLLMDVLEHVADDSGLLDGYAAKVPKGAKFLITVPAFQWLWSDHDLFLEHHRRYSISQLMRVVRKAGLTVERCSYYFGFVLPIASALRVSHRLWPGSRREPTSQLRQHGRLANAALTMMCRAELPVLYANRLGGLSVFCLARKA